MDDRKPPPKKRPGLDPLDDRKPPAKKIKTNKTQNTQSKEHRCPSCDKAFKSHIGCTAHLLKSKKCCENTYLKDQSRVIANLQAQLVEKQIARNLDDELLVATLDNENENIETNDDAFNMTLDENEIEQEEEDEDVVEQEKQLNKQATVCYSVSDHVEIDLLKILHDANTPHFLFKQILDWGKKAKTLNYDFNPARTHRKAQLDYLEKWFGLEYYNAKQVSVTLPGPMELTQPEVINVTCFDFTSMLRSLLSDEKLFGNLENLDVNQQNPFAKYNSHNKKISCSNGATWYKNAWDKICKDPKDFLVPIIFACDETNMGRCGACPLLFTTSLLKQKYRNLAEAWRPLGFIYDLNLLKSNKQQSKMSGDLKAHRLHTVFKAVLESFRDAQRGTTLNNISLTLGKTNKEVVNLKVPLFFIIGDMQGGDKMCCTSASYSSKINRPCRKCNVEGKDLGNPNVNCKKISMERVKTMVEQGRIEDLRAINQKNVYTIFFELCYGACKYGIFSACCPVEPLHSLEAGIMKYLISVLFWEMLMPEGCVILDYLVQKMSEMDRQRFASSGAVDDYPRLLWKNGVSNLKDLDAKYRVGILFTFVMVAMTKEGKEFLDPILKERTNDIIEILEMVLCYWKWLKKESYWKIGDHAAKNAAKEAIRKMLRKIIRLLNRKKGQGWNLPKFHEQLHVPDDIHRNGPPSATNTQPTEHNHIEIVKNNYNNTQKRKLELDKQLGDRLAEGYKIDLVHKLIHQTVGEKSPSKFTGFPRNASSCVMDLVKGEIVYHCNETIAIQPQKMVQTWAEHILSTQPVEHTEKQTFRLYTEYHRNGTIFRAHPKYRSLLPWHDWVTCQYQRERNARQSKVQAQACRIAFGLDEEDYQNNYYVPAELFGFFESNHPENRGEVQAIVKFVDENSIKKTSVLTSSWGMPLGKDTPYSIVSAEQFVRHSLIIPANNDGTTFLEVLPPELWADQFLPDD